MLGMGTFGGRRAVARASALAVLSVPLLTGPLLAGCSTALDQAHSVQTRLGRLHQVGDATVTTPTEDRAAAIAVTYTGVATERELTRLLTEIDRVADEADYPPYRLDLAPADAGTDTLVVDDAFIGSEAEPTVLASWLSVGSALLGDVTYSYQPGNETIVVDSGPGVGHDVGEASRIGYGFHDTTWTFRNGGTAFVVAGRVSPTDVVLFQAVQRSVSSEALPAPAPTWRFERRADHLLLDLDVRLPGPVEPERLTIARYGPDVARLVEAALGAVRADDRPVWLRLHHRTDTTDDLFGYWVSDQHPVRGRDRLMRGWDRWLAALARPHRTG
ncbi:hypothetical protein HIDPHFAB_04468 [Nocardioides sp. T2.26MG-1]|nr:hypothetical protein HIDPHFAB_04468 [Nocardioides sp. T2.26MG-1]